MLREAGLSETVKKGIPRAQCVFVARKRGNDELAPPEALYRDFDQRKKLLEKEYGKDSDEAHNRAFLDCHYEERFRESILASPEALKKLREITARAQDQDIYLVCYEGASKACHRRILLRIAEERFGAKIAVDGAEPAVGRHQK
jgi:hypothetical protein